MFGKIRTIAWFTAVELLGHPATLLLTLAAAAGTLVLPMLQFQRFSEDGRLARDCGIATALLLGLCIAIGGAGRLYRALNDGTSAIALVKPLRRGLWFVGQALGTLLAVVICLTTQSAALLIAEAYSPQYHSIFQSYANVHGLLIAIAVLLGAFVAAALLNRFRAARFPLTAGLCMPLFLWGFVPVVALLPWAEFPPTVLHWGSLSALVPILLLLAQLIALASALAVKLPPGATATLTLLALLGGLRFLYASAYLPLDALSQGGAVSVGTMLYLLPQTLTFSALALWCGTQLLHRRAV